MVNESVAAVSLGAIVYECQVPPERASVLLSELPENHASLIEKQRFSYPNWDFLYTVICNKKKFIDNFKLSEKKQYFMFKKLNFYNFFIK